MGGCLLIIDSREFSGVLPAGGPHAIHFPACSAVSLLAAAADASAVPDHLRFLRELSDADRGHVRGEPALALPTRLAADASGPQPCLLVSAVDSVLELCASPSFCVSASQREPHSIRSSTNNGHSQVCPSQRCFFFFFSGVVCCNLTAKSVRKGSGRERSYTHTGAATPVRVVQSAEQPKSRSASDLPREPEKVLLFFSSCHLLPFFTDLFPVRGL